MRLLDPQQADGDIANLEPRATTMWYTQHQCSCGNKELPQSSYRTYCFDCGVWWWNDKLGKFNEPDTSV